MFRTSCAFASACATSDMQNYFFQTFAWKRKKCTIHVGRGFPEKWYMFDVPKPRKIYSTCKEVPGPHFLRGAVNLDHHSLDLMGLPSYIFSPTPISTSSILFPSWSNLSENKIAGTQPFRKMSRRPLLKSKSLTN